jgi:hypothetical protein
LFDVSTCHDEFFVLDTSMQVRQRIPGANPPKPDAAEVTQRVAASCNARHSLSVTLAQGHGLIYSSVEIHALWAWSEFNGYAS